MAAVPNAEPGDPAVYAPDGWPLQIGDRISSEEWYRLADEFQLPGVETRVPPLGRGHVGYQWTTPWKRSSAIAMNLVGGRVYAARIDYDPTEIGDYDNVYRGHFRIRFKEYMRHYEPDLPPEYHGKVEYYTPPPPPPLDPNEPLGHIVFDLDNPEWDADGRRLRISPDWAPDPAAERAHRLIWPDYSEVGK